MVHWRLHICECPTWESDLENRMKKLKTQAWLCKFHNASLRKPLQSQKKRLDTLYVATQVLGVWGRGEHVPTYITGRGVGDGTKQSLSWVVASRYTSWSIWGHQTSTEFLSDNLVILISSKFPSSWWDWLRISYCPKELPSIDFWLKNSTSESTSYRAPQ